MMYKIVKNITMANQNSERMAFAYSGSWYDEYYIVRAEGNKIEYYTPQTEKWNDLYFDARTIGIFHDTDFDAYVEVVGLMNRANYNFLTSSK